MEASSGTDHVEDPYGEKRGTGSCVYEGELHSPLLREGVLGPRGRWEVLVVLVVIHHVVSGQRHAATFDVSDGLGNVEEGLLCSHHVHKAEGGCSGCEGVANGRALDGVAAVEGPVHEAVGFFACLNFDLKMSM